ncbi:hypothetical protein BST63_14250 [Bradyrhizobium canariense]|uniref:Membrane protein involved in the export of O-antigen and teichoic acid n=1 Tax=Bradyrhizobium canariense TaxID=255045 RepID=A0ABX3X4G9_9BRAD|nr:oligosaccharide flippase family protein [Bradyrhizobium canariense]OSJ14864.1 hypothetical protein BSR47_17630 [Bradyrhizobium canariense]OSJ29582.1 hypothetical protein BST63_14250 [Bradyrhizobium canariense]
MIKRHTLVYLFAHGIPAILGLVSFAVYTHTVDPSEYGFYVVSMTIGGIVSACCFSWIRLSVTRYQSESVDADVRAIALISYVSMLAILGLGLFVTAFLFQNTIALSLATCSALIALSAGAFEIVLEFRRAQLQPAKFFRIAFIRSFLGSVLGIGAAQAGFGGAGIILATSISYLIGIALPGTVDLAKPLPPLSRVEIRKFVSYGVPFAISGILLALCASMDRLAVAYFLGDAMVGTYGASADLTRQMMVLVSMSVASAIFPLAFRRLREEGNSAASGHLAEGLELLVATVAPIALFLILSPEAISRTLIGAKFADEVHVLLPLLAAARFFGSILTFYVHISFQLAERPLLQIVNSVAALLLTAISMIFLVPRFGLVGAATASLLSEIGGLLVGIWLSQRGFPLPWAPLRLVRVLISLSAMATLILLANRLSFYNSWVQLIATLFFAGAGYASAALVLNVGHVRSLGAITVRRLKTLLTDRRQTFFSSQ